MENVAFDTTGTEEPAPATFVERYGDSMKETGKVFVVLLLGLLAFLFVVRPLMKRGLASKPLPEVREVLPQQLPKTVDQLQGEIEAEIAAAEAAAGQPRKLTVLTKRLAAVAQKEPENAARLLRTWLAEEEAR